MVEPQTGILDLLHNLLLLLRPLGKFGHDLSDSRDGKSVAFRHLAIFSLTPDQTLLNQWNLKKANGEDSIALSWRVSPRQVRMVSKSPPQYESQLIIDWDI